MNSPRVELYDECQINNLIWPKTEDGEYAKRFLLPLIKNGVSQYIDNVQTKMYALTIDDLVLPVTVNDAEYENSYVCSPYGYYISYANEAFINLKNKPLKIGIKGLLWGLDKIFKKGKINKVVIVNNWLFSTNLYPNLDKEQIAAISEYLKSRFPHHAILFRSIHTYNGKDLFNSLKKNHFDLVASRQVYFFEYTINHVF